MRSLPLFARFALIPAALAFVQGCSRPSTPPASSDLAPASGLHLAERADFGPEKNPSADPRYDGKAMKNLMNSMSSEMYASSSGFYAESNDDRADVSIGDDFEATTYLSRFMSHADELVGPVEAKLSFERACESGRRIVIGAVGDVLLHQPLASQGMANKREGFSSLWSDLEPYLSAPNLMYANLEGPAAGPLTPSGKVIAEPGYFDKVAYTSYPAFNYRPDLITDLQSSGIDLVSTANNHALDRRSLGADRTIGFLNKAGLPFMGTRTVEESRANPPEKTNWTTITEKDGFRIGWVACTFSTNGIPDPYQQVLRCFEQRSIVLQQIRNLRADPSIDAVIVTPHWGIEYTHTPGADQRGLAKDMIEAGATIVFGNHPHVLQPVDRLVAADGHEGFVIYSLGNFVSGQKGVAKRTSALIYVGLTKGKDGRTFVNGVRHLPLAMMYESGGLTVRPAKGHFDEARVLANRILSRSTEIDPEEALVTNPGCGG
ncbi:MAG: CapA family protein [Bdellovibrionales bacterium]|nr:CapA family protein [Bdellovibrionales bacterium]